MAIFLAFTTLKESIAAEQKPWISVAGKNFIKDGKRFKFIGANAVNLVFYDDWGLDIEKAIRTARENNISVLRLYIDLGWGKDDDFDRIFDIASKYGVYIILAFTDCCCSRDYATLEKYFEVHAPFCNITNRRSVAAFKKLITQVIERKNSINGRIYRDDPVLFAWEIANELEYRHFSRLAVSGWINEIAAHIKTLDKNHLVTIGINADGQEFSGVNSVFQVFNSAELDFYSFHLYPSSEGLVKDGMLPEENFLSNVETAARGFLSLGKPVILGEFGFSNSIDLNLKVRSNKDTAGLYSLAFKKYMDAAFSAGCSGVMFWGWGVPDEINIPMWWSKESHSTADKDFCQSLRQYRILTGEND